MAIGCLPFYHHDGVPWNNNLAENAVKLIASRRRFIDGLMSENGIKDYLIFLSIYQTCVGKGAASCDSCCRGRQTYSSFSANREATTAADQRSWS